MSFNSNKQKLVVGLIEITWYSIWTIVPLIWPSQNPTNIDHQGQRCSAPCVNFEALYLALLLIAIMMRVLFSRRSIDSDPDQTLTLFAGITFIHALLCAALFLYLTSYMFLPEFGACLIDPTRVVALNVLLIWFTIFAPAGVLITLLFFGILCCPMITY